MPRTAQKPTDAVTLLKNDHRTVEGLFEKFEKTNAKTAKEKLAKQICLELMSSTSRLASATSFGLTPADLRLSGGRSIPLAGRSSSA